MRCLSSLALLAVLTLPAGPATGQPSAEAETEQLTLADDPFELTDPHVAKPGGAELAIVGVHERAGRGPRRGTGVLQTEMQLGVAPGLDVRFGQLGAYGNLDARGPPGKATSVDADNFGGGKPDRGGETRLGMLRQITDGRGGSPVTAVLARVRPVYGPGAPSREGDVVALLGQTFHVRDRVVGLNLNLGLTGRLGPPPGVRPNQYSFTAAIGGNVARDTVVVLAYARRQQERGERDSSLVEVGVRHRFADTWPILGLAVGVGTTRDSLALQVSMAAQWLLGADAR